MGDAEGLEVGDVEGLEVGDVEGLEVGDAEGLVVGDNASVHVPALIHVCRMDESVTVLCPFHECV